MPSKNPRNRSGRSSGAWDELQWESWSRLFAMAQEGDEAAYRRFLDEVGPLLLGYVRRRVFDRELVADVYQEVLLTLHKARHTDPSRPLGPWLFTVARNSLLDALGKNRKFAEREVPVENLPEKGGPTEEAGMEDPLFKALAALPEPNRRAVELLKLKGRSLEEAAGELGISVGALKVRAHRGYRRLREILTRKEP